MSLYLLKVFGIFIMVSVLAFAGRLWVSASRLQKEIEAETGDSEHV